MVASVSAKIKGQASSARQQIKQQASSAREKASTKTVSIAQKPTAGISKPSVSSRQEKEISKWEREQLAKVSTSESTALGQVRKQEAEKASLESALSPYKVGEGYDIAAALKSGRVSEDKLTELFGKDAVTQARSQIAASRVEAESQAKLEGELSPYKIDKGYDIVGAVSGGKVPRSDLVKAFGETEVVGAETTSREITSFVKTDAGDYDLAASLQKGVSPSLVQKYFGTAGYEKARDAVSAQKSYEIQLGDLERIAGTSDGKIDMVKAAEAVKKGSISREFLVGATSSGDVLEGERILSEGSGTIPPTQISDVGREVTGKSKKEPLIGKVGSFLFGSGELRALKISALKALTFGGYKTEPQLGMEYEKEASAAEARGEILVDPTTGRELTKSEYISQVRQPTLWEAAQKWVPTSQFWAKGELKSYTSRGPSGYAALAGMTALDIATLFPIIGWGAKGLGIGARATSTGAKVASIGGRAAAETAAKVAIEDIAKAEAEVAVKQAAVNEARTSFARAVSEGAPRIDVENWRAELALRKAELDVSVASRTQRVSAAELRSAGASKLAATASRWPASSRIGSDIYTGASKVANVSVRISGPALKTAGVVGLGTTIASWRESTPVQKAVGLGMSALFLGVPGKVLGAVKSGAEVTLSEGRIPSKVIEVPDVYVPGSAGMPKTSIKGMTVGEQMEAKRSVESSLESLWKGEGTAREPFGKRVYSPRSEFQKVVPKSMFSATPSGEVFNRPVYTVVEVREPAQYFSPWGFPRFTEASAAGLKGSEPAYLTLFSSEVREFPGRISGASSLSEMRSGAESWYREGAKPGTYPGYKEYTGTIEPEFTVPAGTQIGKAEGGVRMWTRARPFGPKIEIQPHYVVDDPGVRTTGFTRGETLKLKLRGVGAEFQSLVERVSPWRGIAKENLEIPFFHETPGGSVYQKMLRKMGEARSSLSRELEDLEVFKSSQGVPDSVLGGKISKLKSGIKQLDEDILAVREDATRAKMIERLEGEERFRVGTARVGESRVLSRYGDRPEIGRVTSGRTAGTRMEEREDPGRPPEEILARVSEGERVTGVSRPSLVSTRLGVTGRTGEDTSRITGDTSRELTGILDRTPRVGITESETRIVGPGRNLTLVSSRATESGREAESRAIPGFGEDLGKSVPLPPILPDIDRGGTKYKRERGGRYPVVIPFAGKLPPLYINMPELLSFSKKRRVLGGERKVDVAGFRMVRA